VGGERRYEGDEGLSVKIDLLLVRECWRCIAWRRRTNYNFVFSVLGVLLCLDCEALETKLFVSLVGGLLFVVTHSARAKLARLNSGTLPLPHFPLPPSVLLTEASVNNSYSTQLQAFELRRLKRHP